MPPGLRRQRLSNGGGWPGGERKVVTRVGGAVVGEIEALKRRSGPLLRSDRLLTVGAGRREEGDGGRAACLCFLYSRTADLPHFIALRFRPAQCHRELAQQLNLLHP